MEAGGPSQLKTDAKRTIALCVPGLSPVLVDAMATSFASLVAQQQSSMLAQSTQKNKLKVKIPPPKFTLVAANSDEINLTSPQFGRVTRNRPKDTFASLGAADMLFKMPAPGQGKRQR